MHAKILYVRSSSVCAQPGTVSLNAVGHMMEELACSGQHVCAALGAATSPCSVKTCTIRLKLFNHSVIYLSSVPIHMLFVPCCMTLHVFGCMALGHSPWRSEVCCFNTVMSLPWFSHCVCA